ncbi:MAG: Hsp70 family protein [Armatimonadota bacterium]|nr:Hsp70 family protein [Armatimonadota bacterium]
MARETIDLGIDLGTTNSCAAVFGPTGPEIVRVGIPERDYMPSVVWNQAGTIHVGDKAYTARSDSKRWDDVHAEFKRMMGSKHEFVFRSSGESMTAEQLSAEVLKELSSHVEGRAAVITVPAWFEAVQREATLRAGNASGFEEVILLQEPVAASLAYGYGLSEMTQQTWLVFDLGGGTLDVALVESNEGEMRVLDHAGDNYCGGSDMDWMILEKLVLPRIADKWQAPRFDKEEKLCKVLKPLVEQAKIELSTRDAASIDIDENVTDLDGKPIRETVVITRLEFESLIEGWLDEAISQASGLLARNAAYADKVGRVLLVGGPTRTPLLRRRVEESLRIPVDVSIDPMTVVARGAAVLAGSRRLSSSVRPRAVGAEVALGLEYKPISIDTDPMVAGKLENSSAVAVVELTRTDGAWSSGRLPVVNGTFMTRVMLENRKRNTFAVRAYDAMGSSVTVVPASFSITHGPEAGPPTSPRSYKLPVKDGIGKDAPVIAITLIEKGSPLPRSETGSYRTIKVIRAGSSDEVICMPLVEGEYDTLNHNRHVGSLLITGTGIARDLPEGSEVSVTLSVDENGIPTISAYVPFLDQSFERLLIIEKPQVDASVLGEEIEEEAAILDAVAVELADRAPETASTHVRKEVQAIRTGLGAIGRLAQPGSTATQEDLEKADKERQALAERVNKIVASMELPKAVADLEEMIDWATGVVDSKGTDEDKEILDAYIKEAREAVQGENLVRLKSKRSGIAGTAWQVLFRYGPFWISTFQDMNTNPGKFDDRNRAETLLNAGRDALSRRDMEDLKAIVWELWDLYPEQARVDASRRCRFDTDIRTG